MRITFPGSAGLMKAAALFLLFLVFGQSFVLAADDAPGAKPPAASSADYMIGAGDVLTVTLSDAPEFGGKFRVSDSGVISMPGVAAPIKAEGQSPLELANSIRTALIDAKQLRDPHVSV